MKPILNAATLCFLLLLMAASKYATAQDTSALLAAPKKSYFKLSASYLTNAVYNGRQDSVAIPYLSGSFGYYHKSGLSISGSFSYNTNSSIIDVFSFDAGYNVDLSRKLSISFDADKPFYNASSTAVESGVKGSLSASASYQPGIVIIDAGLSSVFSDKADILVYGALSHQFSVKGFTDEDGFSITPTFTANFGTQNFYQDYQARAAKKENVNVTSSTVSGSNSFGVLDYELSLPLGYDAKRWGISAVPTYAIPQSRAVSTTTNTLTVLARTFTTSTTTTEALKNVFYAQFTLYLKF